VRTLENLQKSQVDGQIRKLETRLARERDELPPAVLHAYVQSARSRFDGAPVQVFVPILVERAVRAQLGSHRRPSLPIRAWQTAQRLLPVELPRRWAHTKGVARRAVEVGRTLHPEDRDVLVAAAWLHDIGYATPLVKTGMHQLDGARFLAGQGFSPRVCALVAHHAGAAAVAELRGMSAELAEFPDEHTPVRDALWYCDSTTSPDGEPVSYSDRVAEIRARRGPADPVVRALAINGPERAAAVRRTEALLRP